MARLLIIVLIGLLGVACTETSVDGGPSEYFSKISVNVEPVYPGAGANWNDYVRFNNAGANALFQGGVACDGSESGQMDRFGGCIHGGDKKKVVVPGYTNCADLHINDSLGAFEWVCFPTLGVATFYSYKFREGKGLADLISPSGWRTNAVYIRHNGSLIASSPHQVWWGNPIVPLPDNSTATDSEAGVMELSSPGTIYYVDSNRQTIGYRIAANKVGVVVLTGAKLSYNGADDLNCNPGTASSTSAVTRTLFCGEPNRQFLWLEGTFGGFNPDSNASPQAVAAVNWRHSHIHRARFNDFKIGPDPYSVINMRNAVGNSMTDISIVGCSNGGINLETSLYNTLDKIAVNSCLGSSDMALIRLNGSSNNRLSRLSLANLLNATGNLFEIAASSNNIISRFKSMNAAGTIYMHGNGLRISDGSTNNIVTSGLLSNTKYGLVFDSAGSNIVAWLTSTNSENHGVYFQSGTNNHVMSALLVNNWNGLHATNSGTTGTAYGVAAIGNTTEVFIDTPGVAIDNNSYLIRNNICGGTYFAPDCSRDTGSILALAGTPAGLFRGPVTANDTENMSDSSGSAVFESIFDWINFANSFRGWGRSGGYLSDSSRGLCGNAETCTIYDWRLMAGSRVMNVSFDGANQNTAFNGDGGPCTSNALQSDVVLTISGKTFMKHAMEINDDFTGNDDGLCESGEDCVYAPNIGVYQGEGNLFSTGLCTVNSEEPGHVNNVRVIRYATN